MAAQTPSLSPAAERVLVTLMVAAFVLLAAGFSAGPIFEGPDEIEHYRYVRTMVDTGRLPDPAGQPRGQYHQAPLYYWLLAPVRLLLGSDADFALIDGHKNPYHPYLIEVPGSDNKNVYLHHRAEAFPYTRSDVALAVHLMRLISVLIGAGTLLAGYAVFRELWPEQPAFRLLALGVMAFWPQFLHLSGLVNNDNLLFLFATLSLLLMLRILRCGPTPQRSVLLGLTLGAALLTKASANMMVIVVAAFLLLDRRAWRWLPLIAAPVLAVAGWWYIRNTILYHDPTGIQAMFQTWQSEVIRPGRVALDVGLQRTPYAYRTFWARFGHGAVGLPQPFYRAFDVLLGAALLGAVGRGLLLIQRREDRPAALPIKQGVLLAAFIVTWIISLIYGASIAWSGNQGRYLLPGIAAWAALLAYGWLSLIPTPLRLPAALGGALAAAAVAAVALFGFFLPAYRTQPAPAAVEQPLAYRFGSVAELTGISPATVRGRPGEVVEVTLVWKALAPADSELLAYLHSVGADVVRRDSHPATGNLLATEFEVGQTWAETYAIQIPRDAEPQRVYPLVAGLYDPASDAALPAFTPDGGEVPPVVGRVAVNGPPQEAEPQYIFGDAIGLAGIDLARDGDAGQVCVQWIALDEGAVDYQVFAHVLAAGEILAQYDGAPRGGGYSTGAWAAGEVIDDCYPLDLSSVPESGWQVGLGLYNLADGVRLPVRDGAGSPQPNDMVLITP
ncbi:MAG: hypothetical protein Kow00124_26730 [Anaerolineae bacterium]